MRLCLRVDLYLVLYNSVDFFMFFVSLLRVVDKCIEVGIVFIVFWIYYCVEVWVIEDDCINYVIWWIVVVKKLKNKDYKFSFNLFIEFGIDGCGGKKLICGESFCMRFDKYNCWMFEVVKVICKIGGKNVKCIFILGLLVKIVKDFCLIN